MLLSVVLLVVSIAVILFAAELFTNSVEWLGKKLNLGEGAVGSILAAVGTALPETILPMVATPVAIGLVFVMMYHPTLGVANYLLGVVGLAPFKWTYSSGTALYALALVDVWQWTPLIMLIALAGLASLPSEPYEAAHIDGASTLQAFWHITLPLLRPAIVVAVMIEHGLHGYSAARIATKIIERYLKRPAIEPTNTRG